MNKQNRNRLTDTEKRMMVARGKGISALGGRGEQIKRYRLAVTK